MVSGPRQNKCPPSRPASHRSDHWVERPVGLGGLSRPREWSGFDVRPKRLLLPLSSPPATSRRPRRDRSCERPRMELRNIAVSTDPRGTTLVPRSPRVVRPYRSTNTRCPGGGAPRTLTRRRAAVRRRPVTRRRRPESASRSSTDLPHHRWSVSPEAPFFSPAEANRPKTNPVPPAPTSFVVPA